MAAWIWYGPGRVAPQAGATRSWPSAIMSASHRVRSWSRSGTSEPSAPVRAGGGPRSAASARAARRPRARPASARQDATEPDRLGAQVLPDSRRPRGGVALVEHQIDTASTGARRSGSSALAGTGRGCRRRGSWPWPARCAAPWSARARRRPGRSPASSARRAGGGSARPGPAGASAGWQQVKIRRSRSSCHRRAPPRARRGWCSSAAWAWRSSRDASRRRRSRIRLRAVVMIQPAGLGGSPSSTQRCVATAKASCTPVLGQVDVAEGPDQDRDGTAVLVTEHRARRRDRAASIGSEPSTSGLSWNGRTSTGSPQARSPWPPRPARRRGRRASMTQNPPMCSLDSVKGRRSRGPRRRRPGRRWPTTPACRPPPKTHTPADLHLGVERVDLVGRPLCISSGAGCGASSIIAHTEQVLRHGSCFSSFSLWVSARTDGPLYAGRTLGAGGDRLHLAPAGRDSRAPRPPSRVLGGTRDGAERPPARRPRRRQVGARPPLATDTVVLTTSTRPRLQAAVQRTHLARLSMHLSRPAPTTSAGRATRRSPSRPSGARSGGEDEHVRRPRRSTAGVGVAERRGCKLPLRAEQLVPVDAFGHAPEPVTPRPLDRTVQSNTDPLRSPPDDPLATERGNSERRASVGPQGGG